MKIIEGKVKNLRIQKTKYEVLKNNGKQATVSAALGTAVECCSSFTSRFSCRQSMGCKRVYSYM